MENISDFIHTDLGLALIAGLFTLLGSVLTIFIPRLSEKRDRRKSDYQHKLDQCQKEIDELRKKLDIYEAVERSVTGDYLVQKETATAICPICWPNRHKAIPIFGESETGQFVCSCCHHTGIFDRAKVQRLAAENKSDNDAFLRTIRSLNGIGPDSDDFYDGHSYRY